MPFYSEIIDRDLTLGVWQVTESLDELSEQFDFPTYWGERFTSFSSDGRKIEFLAVRLLLKVLCGEEKEIAYLASGRPYLVDGSAQISISHTKGFVAVALHTKQPVGVDIECYSERVERIASRFIRADEATHLPQIERTRALLIHWSAKESAFKLLDEEGVDWRDHLRVHPFCLDHKGSFLLTEYKTTQAQTYSIHYWSHPEFVLTWGVQE
ncbi:MAG: 4'-phosphopantetheinyl transferase family protein [Phocaeicola sp.]